MRITLINFSSRDNGNCQGVVNLLREYYKSNDEEVCVYSMSERSISHCGGCDYECLKQGRNCPIDDKVNEMFESVCQSDTSFYILPNYCDYPCSNYFAFNERSCGYFALDESKLDKYLSSSKKFIVISNGAKDNFIKAFSYQVKDGVEPDVLFLSAKKFGASSLQGNLLLKDDAKDLVIAFANDDIKVEESAMAIVLCKDEILYTVEDIYGKMALSLPKGHIEKGETHIDTAIRECKEETGIVLLKDNFVREGKPYSYKFVDSHHNIVKKIIYPVLFRQRLKGEIKYNEKRVVEIGYKKLYDFYSKCTYDNVKIMISELV